MGGSTEGHQRWKKDMAERIEEEVNDVLGKDHLLCVLQRLLGSRVLLNPCPFLV